MVCSLESGRMAVMARLLAAGSFSPIITEDVSQEKLAAQYIHRELREADEANLLDEEDMNVFGLKPMADPLYLVCCNACKKPVKASQYAAHAELCKSLNPTEESFLELDGGAGQKKPPRKERKKSLIAYANQATMAGEQERFESMDADDTAASEPCLDEQIGAACSFTEIKRNSACVDVGHVVDGSGVSHGNTDLSAGVMPPPKRSKLRIATDRPSPADGPETAYGVNKTMCITSQRAYTCAGYPKGSIEGSERPYDHLAAHQKPGQDHECSLSTNGVPVPLATKMYYSQRNHRLRSAISHLYFAASNEGHCSDMRDTHFLPSMQNPDKVLVQSSEVFLGKSEGCPPAMNFSNQVHVNNVLRPHAAPVGTIKSKYLSKPYSFASNSGTPLGTIQQPNGSVSVT
ncbi:uncharacterized protein LOC100855402 isoform X3 [Vitis vinifera]|uniref:uncharacterized protein LOC100855402 isoform X3 n=1 Tax=Vitis vinifera TaxID=29760 RepID=UPI0008FF86D9|nr:uncharacterized protein LOC100855402 isoform X3 [Vitis vinifera]|eukprot:XP_019075730.1 PREDICTED: uncharacterized protein LOC100855402 isoform X2 [Vitis vinifera]